MPAVAWSLFNIRQQCIFMQSGLAYQCPHSAPGVACLFANPATTLLLFNLHPFYYFIPLQPSNSIPSRPGPHTLSGLWLRPHGGAGGTAGSAAGLQPTPPHGHAAVAAGAAAGAAGAARCAAAAAAAACGADGSRGCHPGCRNGSSIWLRHCHARSGGWGWPGATAAAGRGAGRSQCCYSTSASCCGWQAQGA